jgi:hypothetical protein
MVCDQTVTQQLLAKAIFSDTRPMDTSNKRGIHAAVRCMLSSVPCVVANSVTHAPSGCFIVRVAMTKLGKDSGGFLRRLRLEKIQRQCEPQISMSIAVQRV